MRVWDIPPSKLCKQHLLGEHREVHAIWTILTLKKKGFSKHPETMRWKGKLNALYLRHKALVKEIERRGYTHNSPLDRTLAKGGSKQDVFLESVKVQKEKIRRKKCECRV